MRALGRRALRLLPHAHGLGPRRKRRKSRAHGLPPRPHTQARRRTHHRHRLRKKHIRGRPPRHRDNLPRRGSPPPRARSDHRARHRRPGLESHKDRRKRQGARLPHERQMRRGHGPLPPEHGRPPRLQARRLLQHPRRDRAPAHQQHVHSLRGIGSNRPARQRRRQKLNLPRPARLRRAARREPPLARLRRRRHLLHRRLRAEPPARPPHRTKNRPPRNNPRKSPIRRRARRGRDGGCKIAKAQDNIDSSPTSKRRTESYTLDNKPSPPSTAKYETVRGGLILLAKEILNTLVKKIKLQILIVMYRISLIVH